MKWPKPIEDGEWEAPTEENASRSIAYVMQGRHVLADRARKMRLFTTEPDSALPDDHPMVQAIYEAKKIHDTIPPEDYVTKSKSITEIFKMAHTVYREGNQVSSDIAEIIHARAQLNESKRQHDDKMALMRQRASLSSIPTDAELIALAGTTQTVPWTMETPVEKKVSSDDINLMGPIDP
jgi:hypothetical protein